LKTARGLKEAEARLKDSDPLIEKPGRRLKDSDPLKTDPLKTEGTEARLKDSDPLKPEGTEARLKDSDPLIS